jgi:hypothetical protein
MAHETDTCGECGRLWWQVGHDTSSEASQAYIDDGLCSECREEREAESCPECERSNGPHYRGPCKHV